MANERKEKLIRVLQILQMTDEKTPINANQIIGLLSKDFSVEGVERRSIYRDIKMLQSCGYNIFQADYKRDGWYMGKRIFEDWELKIMMDAVQQANCISINEAQLLREKLLGMTSQRGRSRFMYLLHPITKNQETNRRLGAYIEILLEAMYTQRKVTFQYTEVNDSLERVLRQNGRIYELSPYMIYWDDKNYYLIGAHDTHEGPTTYRLDRIMKLVMTEQPAIDPVSKLGKHPELVVRKYIEKSVHFFSGDEIRIEVEYIPEQTTNAILYDFAGSEIVVQKLDNGKCRASFSKLNSVTLVGWFLQHGTRFQVIGPEVLKREIIRELKESLELYRMEADK